MKKKVYLTLVATLLLSAHLLANVVIIKGTVKSTNGSPVSGAIINIAVYLNSSTTPCSQQTVTTSATGTYTKELSCTGDIRRTRIVTKNCDGTLLVVEKEIPVSKIVEANFTVCLPPPACTAKYIFELIPVSSSTQPYTIRFNNSSSEVGPNDKVAHSTWDFHDGTPVVSDVVNPLHTFPKGGVYEVCLTIKTVLGCESRICKQVTVAPVEIPKCTAKYIFELVPVSSSTQPFTIRFNNSSSEAGPNDKVVHSAWDFHDGTPLVSDVINPLHTFPKAGVYEVCLTIKTLLGCESRICKQVTVAPVEVVKCVAAFSFEKVTPKKFRFNSAANIVGANDNVVERKWDFRDGSTSAEVSPLHEFDKPGTYEVCLFIKTAKGCESKVCTSVKVEEVPNSSVAPIQIISLYPTPVHENLKVIVLSTHAGILATISIVDANGVLLSSTKATLNQGSNGYSFKVLSFTPGLYFIKITTRYGIVSKSFYKV